MLRNGFGEDEDDLRGGAGFTGARRKQPGPAGAGSGKLAGKAEWK